MRIGLQPRRNTGDLSQQERVSEGIHEAGLVALKNMLML